MGKRIDRSLWIGSLLCLMTLIFGLVYYSKMPDSVAVHFDYRGEPNGYASKKLVVFIFPVLMLLLHIIVNVSTAKKVVKDNAAKPLVYVSNWIIPIFTLILQPLTILKSIGKDIPFNTVTTVMLGLILILCGNYFPKNRINPYVGIKYPWLFHDEEVWGKTHWLSGYLWIITGFFLILSSFISFPFPVILTIFLLFIVIIPIVYSLYFIIKRKSKCTK